MVEDRKCEFCGKPLPRNAAPNRRFHDGCRQKKYLATKLRKAFEAGRKSAA